MSFRLNGYYIPADTMVLMNIWAIHHDKNAWKDPDTFNPGMCKDDCNNKNYVTQCHTVNKDESLRNINKSNYVLQLGHSFYFCWQKCFKIYYLQKNVTFLDIKCKFKNNTYKGLLCFQYLFLLVFFRTVSL